MSTQTPYRSSQPPMSDQPTQNRPGSDPQNMQTNLQMVSDQQIQQMMSGRGNPRPGSETKPAIRTTEFYIFLASVGGVLLAAQLVGRDAAGVDPFRANTAWFLITLLSIGYLASRGLSKAGSSWRRHGSQ